MLGSGAGVYKGRRRRRDLEEGARRGGRRSPTRTPVRAAAVARTQEAAAAAWLGWALGPVGRNSSFFKIIPPTEIKS